MVNYPDEISADYIEHICEELRWKLIDVLNGGGDENEYDSASDIIRHISAMLDAIVSD